MYIFGKVNNFLLLVTLFSYEKVFKLYCKFPLFIFGMFVCYCI